MTVTEGAAPTDQEVATPTADAAEGATQAAETTENLQPARVKLVLC